MLIIVRCRLRKLPPTALQIEFQSAPQPALEIGIYTIYVRSLIMNVMDSLVTIFVFMFLLGTVSSKLSPKYYQKSCPDVLSTVHDAVSKALSDEPRMGASLLRLHFHDCFVNASAPYSIKTRMYLQC